MGNAEVRQTEGAHGSWVDFGSGATMTRRRVKSLQTPASLRGSFNGLRTTWTAVAGCHNIAREKTDGRFGDMEIRRQRLLLDSLPWSGLSERELTKEDGNRSVSWASPLTRLEEITGFSPV